jgi:hypothetical protein
MLGAMESHGQTRLRRKMKKFMTAVSSPCWWLPVMVVGVCCALPVPMAHGQTHQGQLQSDSSSGTDIYKLYAAQDPLGGEPEETPTTIGPKGNVCIASNPKWQLITQIGNMCFWYAPFPKRLSGYVVPLFKMSWVESSGGRCGQNPFSDPDDPNGTAICDRPAPAKDPYAPKRRSGQSSDPSMPKTSGCETQGKYIPHCF